MLRYGENDDKLVILRNFPVIKPVQPLRKNGAGVRIMSDFITVFKKPLHKLCYR